MRSIASIYTCYDTENVLSTDLVFLHEPRKLRHLLPGRLDGKRRFHEFYWCTYASEAMCGIPKFCRLVAAVSGGPHEHLLPQEYATDGIAQYCFDCCFAMLWILLSI